MNKQIMKRAGAFLLVLLMTLCCCAAQGETLQERSFPATEQYVKLTGRTVMENDVRWIIHSASTVQFRFTGTRASVVIVGDSSATGSASSRARYAVYVNGERVLDRTVGSRQETVEIFASDTETEVEIMIVKLSEAANSVFGIRQINVTSAGEIEPLPAKKLKIEFIGDSITCGYGVDDENRDHHFSTETEDATRTYAWKTAMALDADSSFVSYSGHGIISGYSGDGNKVGSQTVPAVYELLGKNYGSAASVIDLNQAWDFSAFRPDIVVINLGTNDDSYTLQDAGRKEEFTLAYVEFLKMVRKNNPDALMIACLGVMGDRLYPCVKDAVMRYKAETGDENIRPLHLPVQDGSTGYAADWHPTEATHQRVADFLIEKLQ